MENTFETIDILSVFGLTEKQTALLFSLQRDCVLNDARNSKTEEHQTKKKEWADKWCKIISNTSDENAEQAIELIDSTNLVQGFKDELSKTAAKTWFHLIILEAVTFTAYFPLSDDKDENKTHSKLKYQNQIEYIKEFIVKVGYGKPEIADLYYKMYKKAEDKATGKTNRIIRNVLIIALAAALTAATAGVFAGKIAVLLVGAKFAGLKGAALVAACLAYLGGGAIAAGGLGMAGGVMVIVGGGALLGGAAGGAAIAGKVALFGSSSKFALSFAAKLDVVLREIILNEQKDIKLAQAILSNYKENIVELKSAIAKLKLENEKNKAQIKNLEESVKYMENIYKEMNRFTSSFEIGMEHEE